MTLLSARLDELGITLPEPAPVKGRYRRVVVHGDTAYVSGAIAILADPPRVAYAGEVGTELTMDEARDSARAALLGVIASLAELAARTAVGVAELPDGASVMIDAVVAITG